jgi:hypothetical protein
MNTQTRKTNQADKQNLDKDGDGKITSGFYMSKR